jgi:exopolysaccharide biosynthesis WecB/TagA/CpsF family protein
LGLLLAFPGVVVSALSLYLVTLAVASAAFRLPPPKHSTATKRLTVLVPAHDEESLIGRCVRSLLAQSYPRVLFRIAVVADNCSDATAAEAEASGAEVMLRNQPDARGKGHALRWSMDRLLAGPHPWDAIVVVDADSVADPNLLAALAAELDAGAEVVQADYALLQEGDSGKSELANAGFLLFHRVRFSGRARLGMAANLVGNGMLLSRRVLEAHPWDAFTGVEDLEYSMRLRLAGIRPRFAPRASVAGPGPASRSGAVRQRLRWEGGRFHVVRRQLLHLVSAAIVRRDLRLLDAAIDLATPPLALLSLAIMAGSVLGAIAVTAGLAPWWALAPWVIALAAIPAFVGIGLWAGGAPFATWRALAKAPSFLVWKALVYLRLLRGFDVRRWDRTDRAVEVAPQELRRVDIAGVPIDAVDMPTALARIGSAIGGPRTFQVSTINLDFLVRAQREETVRNIFLRSDLNLADGAPVVLLGRLLGARIPGRVAGADLIPALVGEAARTGARIFLLGGEDGVALAAAARLRQLYSGLVIAGTYEPPRAAVEDMNNTEILWRISEASPDVLLVAFGHPKQERWIDVHREQLGVSVAIGVGCVLDLIAGRRRRAPRWMQATGLEWAYRLTQEPRRLWGRYLTDAAWLVLFGARALRSRLGGKHVIQPALNRSSGGLGITAEP